MNEPKVANRNKLNTLFWWPTYLGIRVSTAKHFSFKHRAPPVPRTLVTPPGVGGGRRTTLPAAKNSPTFSRLFAELHRLVCYACSVNHFKQFPGRHFRPDISLICGKFSLTLRSAKIPDICRFSGHDHHACTERIPVKYYYETASGVKVNKKFSNDCQTMKALFAFVLKCYFLCLLFEVL